MAEQLPTGLERGRHVDLEARPHAPWVRRAIVAALTVLLVLALLNVFGQNPRTSLADTAAARLVVEAPDRIRGGIFYQARIEVTARRRLAHPRLRLDQGFAEEQSINTIEPAPTDEASEEGRIELSYDTLEPGRRLVVWLQFQANPATFGRRAQGVTLLDGDERVAYVSRRLTQFP